MERSFVSDQSDDKKSISNLEDRLSPEQYNIARQEGTERAFTSPLNNEKRDGEYLCVVCDTPLWSSAHKYDSGSGWPSFYQPASNNVVGIKRDTKLASVRTEVHCANCNSHMGHVFEDGPEPTGLRYCINGSVLKFRPAE